MSLTIGPLHIRRSTFIKASPARVWKEFESFESLAAWFGIGHTLESYEPKAGSVIRLRSVCAVPPTITDPDCRTCGTASQPTHW